MVTILILIVLIILYKYCLKKNFLSWAGLILLGIAGIGYAYIELYFLLSVERRIYGIISSPSSILFVGYFVAFFIPWIVGAILLLVDICMQISNTSTVANDNSTSNHTTVNNVKNVEGEKQKKEELEEQNLGCRIYKKCKEKNILSISDDNISSFKIIASSYGVTDIEKAKRCFYIGEKIVKEEERLETIKIAKENYTKENKEYLDNLKNANVSGRNKYLSLLNTHMSYAYNDYRWNNLDLEDDVWLMNKKHKDKNWELRGAVAGSLWGSGVGTATALKTQKENEEHKKKVADYNERGRKDYNEHMKKKNEIEKRAKDLQKKIEYINDRLIDMDSQLNFFKLFEFSNKTYFISKGMNFYVSFDYKLKDKVTLLDSPAIIDGSFLIRIKDDNRVIATGYYTADNFYDYDTKTFNLKYAGFKEKGRISLCICRSNMFNVDLDKEKEYTIDIQPYKLWSIEK